MQMFSVPLISGVAEHETLVTSTEVVLFLVSVDTVSDLDCLGLHIHDDVAVGAVKTHLVGLVANLLGDVTSYLLEVDLVFGGAGLTEQNDLKQR